VRDINIDILNPHSIEAGITALEEWQADMERRTEIVQQRIVDLLITRIQSNLAVAEHDLVEWYGSPVHITSTYDVTASKDGNSTIITVVSKSADPKTGEFKPDIAFVEFGAGRYATGESPLKEDAVPMAVKSIERGSYGKGLGAGDKWYFSYGFSSTGTPQSNAIGNALEEVTKEVEVIVRETFI
jgi:hypothetical protein